MMKKDIVEIIEYLNSKAGKRFKLDTKPTIYLITRLYSLGYTKVDMKAVIDMKVLEWSKLLSMKRFIRPATLFELSNFRRYLKVATKN